MARELRFAVGDQQRLRSSVWRMWGNRGDLYVAARSSAGVGKFSFHASGVWRLASVSNDPRSAMDRWTRPAATEDGIVRVLMIMVPDYDVPDPMQDRRPTDKPLILISGPARGTKTMLFTLLAPRAFTKAHIEALPSPSPLTVHDHILLERETAWLISYSLPLLPAETAYIDRNVSTTRINIPHGIALDQVYSAAFLLQKDDGHTPLFYDVQLGRGNIFINEPA